MKAITIHQPYAHLISTGEKRVENRTWPTCHRGPLAIHAGKSRAWWTDEYGLTENQVAFGAFVAVADLVACLDYDRIRRGEIQDLFISWVRTHRHAEGPWCFILHNVRALPMPIEARGKQGLWNIDEPCLSLILQQLPMEDRQ